MGGWRGGGDGAGAGRGGVSAIEWDFQRVYDNGLRLLARRDHGEGELARKLAARGAPADLVSRALARCREQGYLDDARFAAGRARTRLAAHHGPARILAELKALGVAEGVARQGLEEALAEFPGTRDEAALAREALCRRYGEAPPADPRERKRRHDFLARRGFGFEAIRAAMEHREHD